MVKIEKWAVIGKQPPVKIVRVIRLPKRLRYQNLAIATMAKWAKAENQEGDWRGDHYPQTGGTERAGWIG